jgi:hypothetical protein
MTQKTKVALLVIGALLIGGTATAIIINNRKKKTPTKTKKGTTIIEGIKTTDSEGNIIRTEPIVSPQGTLVDTNWDDNGGYYYIFTDGQQDYYRKNGTFVGTRDAQGKGLIVVINGVETNCEGVSNSWCM